MHMTCAQLHLAVGSCCFCYGLSSPSVEAAAPVSAPSCTALRLYTICTHKGLTELYGHLPFVTGLNLPCVKSAAALPEPSWTVIIMHMTCAQTHLAVCSCCVCYGLDSPPVGSAAPFPEPSCTALRLSRLLLSFCHLQWMCWVKQSAKLEE